MIEVLVALLPVVAFLLLLILFDSFKLVSKGQLTIALASGALVAIVASSLHAWLFERSGLEVSTFARYIAPITEETLKAMCLLYPLLRRQIGFRVDELHIFERGKLRAIFVGQAFNAIDEVEHDVRGLGCLSRACDPDPLDQIRALAKTRGLQEDRS